MAKKKNYQGLLFVVFFFVVLFAASYFTKVFFFSEEGQNSLPESFDSSLLQEVKRIICLAPSLTESAFILGLGESVVAVSDYCDYPEQALEKERVGGLHGVHYEKIIDLDPDLVLALTSQHEAQEKLEGLGIEVLSLKHESIEEVFESLQLIGKRCGKQKEAKNIIQGFKSRIQGVQDKVAGRQKPRVLISVERDLSLGRLGTLWIVGQERFYNAIIEIAGGKNAYEEGWLSFPQLSVEGIIQLNPDIIIDLAPNLQVTDLSQEAIRQDWEVLTSVKAVVEQQVFVVTNPSFVRPGPRLISAIEYFARLIHPDLEWQ